MEQGRQRPVSWAEADHDEGKRRENGERVARVHVLRGVLQWRARRSSVLIAGRLDRMRVYVQGARCAS
eukprot:5456556-Pleurochrysis_carterae.AAC.4